MGAIADHIHHVCKHYHDGKKSLSVRFQTLFLHKTIVEDFMRCDVEML